MANFNKWIHQEGLIGMKFKGSDFTWCNGQAGLTRSWVKLDRALLNAPLLSSCPNAVCSILPWTTSDHSPLLLELNANPFNMVRRCFASTNVG